MSKKNRPKSHKQHHVQKTVPRIKKERPTKSFVSHSEASEAASVDGGQSFGEIFDPQADRINKKSSKSSGHRRSIESPSDEISPEREKIVKSKNRNRSNRMGKDIFQKMYSSRNDKDRNSRYKSSISVAFPTMKLIKVVRESEGGVERVNESAVRSLNLASALKDRTAVLDSKSAFASGRSTYKSSTILQEKQKCHARRLAKRNAFIICLLVTMTLIIFSCLLLYIFGVFGEEEEFRSFPFKFSTTSSTTKQTKVPVWVDDWDLLTRKTWTTTLFPTTRSTTIGSTITTIEVKEETTQPWVDPGAITKTPPFPAVAEEISTTPELVEETSTTTKEEDVTFTDDSSLSETTGSVVTVTTPEKRTTAPWPDYGNEGVREETSTKRRIRTPTTTPGPSGRRMTTTTKRNVTGGKRSKTRRTSEKTMATPMDDATSGRRTKFRTTTDDNRTTKEKETTKDGSWFDWILSD